MLQFSVNDGRCTRCGLCVLDCPAFIIDREGDGLPHIEPDKEPLCLQCQHCLAICPTGAVSILGRKPEDSQPLSADSFPRLEDMSRFVRGRRSVRQYKDENVDPGLLRQLLATLANVPTGVNQRKLTFSVIDDKAVMQRLREKTLAALAAAVESGRIPEDCVYLRRLAPAYYRQRRDLMFRGAPHALIVSAPPTAACGHEDVVLALAYFELLAQSAGLGTVWWGMLRMVFETLPELKPLIGVPDGHFYYAMLFGVPAIRYARTVQRDDAAVIRKVTL